MNDATPAQRLKAARERAGLSQREAAKRLDVHYGSMNRYEGGKMRVPADLLTRAEALPDKATRETPVSASPAPSAEPEVPTVAIPLHELTYWRGIIESEHRHLNGVGKSLESLLGMLNDATRGIGGFLAADVLRAPAPTAPTPTREELAAARQAMDEAHARAAIFEAQLRALGAIPPETATSPQRKAGGT